MLGSLVQSLDLLVQPLRVLVAIPLQLLLLGEELGPLLEKDSLPFLVLGELFLGRLQTV